MRAGVLADRGYAAAARIAPANVPRLVELITELVSAGLISIDVSDDGETTYALTPRGQQAARAMAMSRNAHALVLLGALLRASEDPN